MKGETKIAAAIVVLILIVVGIVFAFSPRPSGISPPGSGISPPSPIPPSPPPQNQVRAFDLGRFTSPTASFIATLANLLIEATR